MELSIPLYYTPVFFKLHELVSPEIYKLASGYKNRDITLLSQLDRNSLIAIDAMRRKYGPIVINNWYEATEKGYRVRNGNGIFKQSGLRDKGAVANSAKLSQHFLGKAFDLKFKNTTAPKVMIEMDKLELFKNGKWRLDPDPIYNPYRMITVIERSIKGVLCSWLHIDTRLQGSGNGAIVPLDL